MIEEHQRIHFVKELEVRGIRRDIPPNCKPIIILTLHRGKLGRKYVKIACQNEMKLQIINLLIHQRPGIARNG